MVIPFSEAGSRRDLDVKPPLAAIGIALYETDAKVWARQQIIETYRARMQRPSIPGEAQYWTLCSRQSRSARSEIEQMTRSGLIQKKQFYGVDYDKHNWIMTANRRDHPEANWHRGEWIQVIRTARTFNPAIVYLDTTCFAEHRSALRLISNTMIFCPFGTLLFANFIVRDPRSSRRFDPAAVIRALPSHLPSVEIAAWNLEVRSYGYRNRHTVMRTYILQKGGY